VCFTGGKGAAVHDDLRNDVAALVAGARQGDQEAWDALVHRFTGLLWSIARSFRLNDAMAGDVVQTTWLRLLEHLGDLHDPSVLGAWLATTARRESMRLLRHGHREAMSPDEQLERVEDPGPVVDAALMERERDAQLWAAVDRLPSRCQRLIRVLMASPPPSYQEVAAALEMPVGSIGPTRARCLEHLRRDIAAAGISATLRDSAH
jgi:RNA polymerase sigma factor (sigma-70 family)